MSIKNNFILQYDGDQFCVKTKELITNNHYSKSYRSQRQVHIFSLLRNNTKVGVAVFGRPMSRHNDIEGVLELRRFCLIDDTPKNTESYFIGLCIRWIRKNDKKVKSIISFSDPNKKHKGTIYKASNFKLLGQEKASNPRVIKHGRKQIHIRQAYQKKNNEYTKDALRIQELIKTNKAKVISVKKKLKFEYILR